MAYLLRLLMTNIATMKRIVAQPETEAINIIAILLFQKPVALFWSTGVPTEFGSVLV